MFDNYDDDFDDDFDEEFDDSEEKELEELEELDDREEEIIEELEENRDEISDAIHDKRDAIQDHIDELKDEVSDVGDIRKEIEDFRRMKEDMRRELEDIRRTKAERKRHRTGHGPKPPKPVKSIRAPKPPKLARTLDFTVLTDSLEDMMEGLGEQIELSIKGVKGIDKIIPSMRVSRSKRKRSKRSKRSKREIESIPPERIAKVLAPLGNEERLKILNFLKGDGKTFNELEVHTGKTGSSLTHHLNPLLDEKYVIKGEVRGTYYVTVEGRLAYRLAQWLTSRLERERVSEDKKKEKLDSQKDDNVSIEFDSADEDDSHDDEWSE
ncbi:MAG: ArsR/SmtB family transcription factor [Candidatus Thorarchaeota archaeon]